MISNAGRPNYINREPKSTSKNGFAVFVFTSAVSACIGKHNTHANYVIPKKTTNYLNIINGCPVAGPHLINLPSYLPTYPSLREKRGVDFLTN